MRSLGDMQWLNDYIGIPYRFGGRDADGLDCYGLVKMIYEKEYYTQLPDWLTDVRDLKVRNDEFTKAITSGDFVEKEAPSDGDFVVCYRTRAAHHMGLYFAGGVIHCVEGTGVSYEHLAKFQRKYVKVVFGEWTPDVDS